jgi:hypothetical protein
MMKQAKRFFVRRSTHLGRSLGAWTTGMAARFISNQLTYFVPSRQMAICTSKKEVVHWALGKNFLDLASYL